MTEGGGGIHPLRFLPLTQKISDDPYLKLLDFSKLLVADALMNPPPFIEKLSEILFRNKFKN